MKTQTKELTAKERILEKAEELFYSQGYQATGINQIIEESGVAKATFYSHFPSKDDLCLAYLQRVNQREVARAKETIQECKTPLKRFMCLVEMLPVWLEENQYKGCAFLNMIPEVIDPKSPIRKVGKMHYEGMRMALEELTKDLIVSDKKRYGHLDSRDIAEKYMTILTGAISLCVLYHDGEPMKRAASMVKSLIE